MDSELLKLFHFHIRGGRHLEIIQMTSLTEKAVFVRISDEYAANILRTALFTVIVRYIFTSCREYPGNNVGLTKT